MILIMQKILFFKNARYNVVFFLFNFTIVFYRVESFQCNMSHILSFDLQLSSFQLILFLMLFVCFES